MLRLVIHGFFWVEVRKQGQLWSRWSRFSNQGTKPTKQKTFSAKWFGSFLQSRKQHVAWYIPVQWVKLEEKNICSLYLEYNLQKNVIKNFSVAIDDSSAAKTFSIINCNRTCLAQGRHYCQGLHGFRLQNNNTISLKQILSTLIKVFEEAHTSINLNSIRIEIHLEIRPTSF